tara:strand:- start:288 stop:479 length:192 start_codon:yes stop_codon:yes gene_type:complete
MDLTIPSVRGKELTRYRVTMDVMVDTTTCEPPKSWNWEQLLDLDVHEQMNDVYVEDLGEYTIL